MNCSGCSACAAVCLKEDCIKMGHNIDVFMIRQKGEWIVWKKYLQLLQFINQKNFCPN